MPPKAGGAAAAGSGGGPAGNARRGGAAAVKRPQQSTSATPGAGSGPGNTSQDRNKVVVRRCPPELPEAVFWQSVEPWTRDDAVDWKLYKQGRTRVHGSNKESVNSVAYIHFRRQEHVASFAAAYQGHTFRDSKGNRFQVIVQYAPFQKIPPKKIKPDPLSGTVDDDADYLAFVKSLDEPGETEQAKIPEVPPSTKGIKKTTPLLDELRRKKQENARRKQEDSKQSRSAKRVAARAAAAAGPTGSSTGGVTGEKATSVDTKAAKRAEKEKKKKAERNKKKDAKAETAAAPVPASASKPGHAGPPPKQATKPAKNAKAPTVAKQTTAPIPKITILAPPKAALQKKESQTVPPPPPAPVVDMPPPSSGVGAQPAMKAPAAPNSTKSKAPSSTFDDIVGQFAKQMQGKPISKPQTGSGIAKGKPVSSASDQVNSTSSKAQSANSPADRPDKPSPPPAGNPARGRGRGSAPPQRGRRNASSAGRGTPLSPKGATATPAPS